MNAPEPISPDDLNRMYAEDRTGSSVAWECFARWLSWWRAAHEDDERDTLNLVEEYGRWCEENPNW